MKVKFIAVTIIVLVLITVLVPVFYVQNEFNAYVSAAKQLRFSITGVGVWSMSINYLRNWTWILFYIDYEISNPSRDRNLAVPSFNLIVYMDNNEVGNVSTTQCYLAYPSLSSSSTLESAVDSDHFSSTFKDTFLSLADKVWNNQKPLVTFRVVGTANINVAYSFLSATVPVPIDASKTVNLSILP